MRPLFVRCDTRPPAALAAVLLLPLFAVSPILAASKPPNYEMTVGRISLGLDEKQVLSILGTPGDVRVDDTTKTYVYGSPNGQWDGEGYLIPEALIIYFRKGLVTGVRHVYAGATDHPEDYPLMIDQMPIELLSRKYTVVDEDTTQYLKLLRWDINGDEMITVQVAHPPIRKFDPQENRFYFEKSKFVQYRLMMMTLMARNQ